MNLLQSSKISLMNMYQVNSLFPVFTSESYKLFLQYPCSSTFAMIFQIKKKSSLFCPISEHTYPYVYYTKWQ